MLSRGRIRLTKRLALTVTLSPGRGNYFSSALGIHQPVRLLQRWNKFTLSQREWAGVRENIPLQLNGWLSRPVTCVS